MLWTYIIGTVYLLFLIVIETAGHHFLGSKYLVVFVVSSRLFIPAEVGRGAHHDTIYYHYLKALKAKLYYEYLRRK